MFTIEKNVSFKEFEIRLVTQAKFGKKIYAFSLSVYIEIYKKIKITIIKYYFLSNKIIDNREAIIITKFCIYSF